MHRFTLSAPYRVVAIRECAACGAKNRVPLDELRLAKCGRCKEALPAKNSGIQCADPQGQADVGRVRR